MAPNDETSTISDERAAGAARVAAVFELLPEMVVVLDENGLIAVVNQRLLDTMGYRREDVIGTNIFDYVHPDDLAYMAWSWEQREAHPHQTGILVQARGRDADGSWRAVEILGLSLLDDPDVRGMVMTMRDLTDRVGLGDSPARLRSMIDRTTDVVMLLAPSGSILYANRRLTSRYGHDHDRIVGLPVSSILHADDEAVAAEWLRGLVGAGDRATARVRLRVLDPTGVAHAVEWQGTNQLDDPLIDGIIVSGRDITELVAMETQVREQTEQLSYAADHDPLTGLLNRRAFVACCQTSLEQRRRQGPDGDLVVLFCDLDRFKIVNDTHGHDMGDRVLETVGARLASCVRDGDEVGRYGGDEFTVLLAADATPAGVTALVARIGARLAEPMTFGAVTADVGVTIGIGRSRIADADVDELLRAADRAMYAKKLRS
jgi:diguanylate cyclase (GGDEF)-like protein/PAS domain S-box-containing protein